MFKLLKEIQSQGIKHPLLLSAKEQLILRTAASSSSSKRTSLLSVSTQINCGKY